MVPFVPCATLIAIRQFLYTMARPIKNSCDYFPHDAGMRNHRKIKSIRQKFGITGYAIWCMIIEYLTESDGNVFEDTELEFELMSGDFGVSVTETREVVDYCYRLELLFLNNGFVSSESLDERLKPVYDKRGRAKEMSAKQIRKNGLFHRNTDEVVVSVTETPIDTVVYDTETPQSKLNKIKLNKTKENNNIIIIEENIEIENNNSETLETEKEKRKKVAPKKESEPMYDTQFLNLNSENIKISISEFEKLCTEYTQEISEQSIIYLSDYKTEKAYKTKSDYLTIKRWVASAVKEKILKNKKIQNDTKTIDGGRENTFGGFKQSEIDRFFNQ